MKNKERVFIDRLVDLTKLTRGRFATMVMGCSYNQMLRIVSGNGTITPDRVRCICTYLGISIDKYDLLFDIVDEQTTVSDIVDAIPEISFNGVQPVGKGGDLLRRKDDMKSSLYYFLNVYNKYGKEEQLDNFISTILRERTEIA